jgi:hypothetical protein
MASTVTASPVDARAKYEHYTEDKEYSRGSSHRSLETKILFEIH